ncbi:MAG: hypothetical protein M3441_06745 [Chloroflexota bacterium]|nr:hypothetical protein [Chloroflexota bacterium]
MEFNRWWNDDPAEVYWLEITDREDLGTDLNAPQRRDDGEEYYGYSLIEEIHDNDIIFHYHKDAKAIVLWSKASGRSWEDEVVWGAHGTSARGAGVRPYVRPGRRLGLAGSQPLIDPVTLQDLRANQDQILAIRERLERAHRGSLYFPFELSPNRPLRPTQAYLTKLPVDVVRLFAPLSEAAEQAKLTTTNLSTGHRIRESANVWSSIGVSYRRANEEISISERDPFQVDPALVERANRGHAATQNMLAQYLSGKGIEPLSPKPADPNFDLAWLHDGIVFVAEVKSITPENEERQLRLGLGQLLRYRYLLAKTGRSVKAVLMLERKPEDQGWTELCEQEGIILAWPDRLDEVWLEHS